MIYYCAAEAVFCYTAENSHHLKASVTSKNTQFQEEKISAIKRARCHISMEKSSKNLISFFWEMPARGLPKPSPPPRRESAQLTRGKSEDAGRGREIQMRNWDAENGGKGGK
jgi:hypothetical protein